MSKGDGKTNRKKEKSFSEKGIDNDSNVKYNIITEREEAKNVKKTGRQNAIQTAGHNPKMRK